MSKFFSRFWDFFSWVPMVAFFIILAVMFLADFRSPTDEYFVRTVLRACLIILISTLFVQFLALGVMSLFYGAVAESQTPYFQRAFQALSAFPIIDVFIFSVALFYRSLTTPEWILFLTIAMFISTIDYWLKMIHGPIKEMHAFARIHKIPFVKIMLTLSPFYFNTFNAYFFVALKKVILPLTFIFIFSDFRIVVPRLVESGLSVESFVLFVSLILSLHLLSKNELHHG